MFLRKYLGLSLAFAAGISLIAPLAAAGQAEGRHGRKYKAPDVTSHVEVTVIKGFNGKPIPNAAVIFRSVRDGKDEGNLEVKTDPDGKAIIDVIPTGSSVRIQVIASGFATFGEDYQIDTATREIQVTMLKPRAQVSAYSDNTDNPSERKPGVQEPAHQKPKPATSPTPVLIPVPAAGPAPAAPAPAPSSTPTPPQN